MKTARSRRPAVPSSARGSVLRRIHRVLWGTWGPQGWWPGTSRFEIALGALLTQNTAWSNVERALARLREAGRLEFRALRDASDAEIGGWIRPAGTWRVKTRRVRALLEWLDRECGGDLSRLRHRSDAELRASLLAVHGIGPETADSILLYALDRTVFVVDAYTRRILSRHGWADPAAGYSEIQSMFHAAMPPDVRVYNECHALLVRLAKEHCRARPRCAGCPCDRLWPISPAARPAEGAP